MQQFIHISDIYFPPTFFSSPNLPSQSSLNSNSVLLPMFIFYPKNTTIFQNGFNICMINVFKAFILVLCPVSSNPFPPLVAEVLFYAFDPVKQYHIFTIWFTTLWTILNIEMLYLLQLHNRKLINKSTYVYKEIIPMWLLFEIDIKWIKYFLLILQLTCTLGCATMSHFQVAALKNSFQAWP